MAEDQIETIEEAQPETKLPLEQAIEDATPEGEAPEEPKTIAPETVQKARDMGWVPKDEWRGNPDIWREADEFARRGEEVLPIVQSSNRRMKEEIARNKTEMADLREQMGSLKGEFEETLATRTKRLEGMTKAALASQREQLFKTFEVEKRKAVAEGNTDEYDRLSGEQHDAMSKFKPEADFAEEAPAPKVKEPKQESQKVPPEVGTWMETNQWFTRDAAMTAWATARHQEIMDAHPAMSLADNLAKVTDEAKVTFPAKFGIEPTTNGAAKPHAPSVEGGGRQAQAAAKDKGWNDLPPEAKQAAKNNFEDGLFGADKSKEKAQREYAEIYWSQ